MLPEALRDQVLLQNEGAKGAFARIIGTAPGRQCRRRPTTPSQASYHTEKFGLDPSSTQFADKAYDAAFLIGVALGAQPDPFQTVTGSELSQTLELIVPANASASESATRRAPCQFTQIVGALSAGHPHRDHRCLQRTPPSMRTTIPLDVTIERVVDRRQPTGCSSMNRCPEPETIE